MRNFLKLTLVAALIQSASAGDLTGLLTAQQQSSVIANSLTIANAQLTVERQARDLGINLFDKTRIKASANNTQYFDELDRREDSTFGSIDLTQPLTNEFSVGARLTTENQTTLSLEYQPFANEWISAQQHYGYEQATIRLKFAEQKVLTDAQRTWVDYLLAQQKLALAEQKLSLAQLDEQALAQAALVDTVSSNDLIDAQRETVSAQQDLLNAKMSLAEQQLAITQLFNEPVEQPELPNIAELTAIVERNERAMSEWVEQTAKSENTELALAKLNYLNASANDIDLFDSELTFTSSYELDSEVFKAGVSVNLSPSAWNKDKQLDAALDISMQQLELEHQQESLSLAVQLQQQRVQLQNESLRVATLSFQQQQQQLEEVGLLYELGERTGLELTEQKVRVADAQLSVQTALLNLISSQLALSAFFS